MTLANRLITLAYAFCLALTPLAAAGQPAQAPTLQQFEAAQTWLKGRVDEANRGEATMPLLSSPSEGAMIRTALDPRALTLIDFTKLQTGMDVCMPALAIPRAYLMAGISSPDTAVVRPTDDQIRQIRANSALYRDEASIAISFTIDCFGQILAPLENFWSRLSPPLQVERRTDVVAIRDGSTMMYLGGIVMLTETVYSETNRSELLSALVRNGGEFAKVMTLAQRAQIRAEIADGLQVVPANLRAQLKTLRTIFSGADCTGLCSI